MRNKIDLKEMQEIELSLLKYIHNICEENALDYYLCGGTLLGAIRHKGFIPWDDDIDIFMFRDHYLRLIEILVATRHESIEMMSIYNKEDYYYPFAKIVHKQTTLIETDIPRIEGMGVYIDIFPVDGLPKSERDRDKYFRKILLLRRLLGYSISLKSRNRLAAVLKQPAKLLLNLIGVNRILKVIDKTAMKYDISTSDYVACSVVGYGAKEIVPQTIFSRKIKQQFEEFEFYIPIGYDIYLTNLYGDYMKLPAKEDRKTHHENVCFWNDENSENNKF